MSTLEHVLGHANGIRSERLPRLEDEPEDWVPCCYGAVMDGPRGCTCWEAIFDTEQSVDLQIGPMPLARKCCHDCAYRRGSPEREKGEADHLEEIAGHPRELFLCHQGMLRVVGWRHPQIGEFPYAGPGDYHPPKRDGRVYQVDGRPGVLCAGWGALGGMR